jgi:adenosylcobinamide kinase/adenosylcobinamide-phosphate guanylyltransferase
MITLILGGVRSGKSGLAENLAADSGRAVTYIATATASDESMAERITQHRERRPRGWSNVEEPLQLAQAIDDADREGGCLLVDCLSIWMTNLLIAEDDTRLDREVRALLERLQEIEGDLILVSSETSMGIVPMGDLSRQYCDRIGLLHQRVAEIAERVILAVAGLPHVLKGDPI